MMMHMMILGTSVKVYSSEHGHIGNGQGVRERARVFETLNFFKRPDVAVFCVFSGNTIACSCSMSATGAHSSKALPTEALVPSP